MKAVTWLGSWVALVVTAVVAAVLVIARRLPVLAAVVAVFAWAGEAGGVAIGKAAVGRDRPPQAIWLVHAHGWSFPSGHSAVACLAFSILALCAATLARNRPPPDRLVPARPLASTLIYRPPAPEPLRSHR
jgi:membrane-associated phospholipid phosphatase